jgi:hypothetical protein
MALNTDIPSFAGLTGQSATPADIRGWLKHLYIWACPSWRTTACSTPGNPDPGGY